MTDLLFENLFHESNDVFLTLLVLLVLFKSYVRENKLERKRLGYVSIYNIY